MMIARQLVIADGGFVRCRVVAKRKYCILFSPAASDSKFARSVDSFFNAVVDGFGINY
ncbi:MAG: hypothetical protein HRU25_03575 [Psychrobium sp.]|nr:hypothetical protein [Psychrobium sp.]